MFKLRRKTAKGQDLLRSQLFDERTFYQAFSKDLRRARKSITIESPYLTPRRARQFARTFRKLRRRGIKVRINTRDPKHHSPRLRMQALIAIPILRQSGVQIYTYSDMRHRKLAVIDNSILWDGSLNIFSQSYSKEVMRRTCSPQLCKQMISFTGLNNRFW